MICSSARIVPAFDNTISQGTIKTHQSIRVPYQHSREKTLENLRKQTESENTMNKSKKSFANTDLNNHPIRKNILEKKLTIAKKAKKWSLFEANPISRPQCLKPVGAGYPPRWEQKVPQAVSEGTHGFLRGFLGFFFWFSFFVS